VKDRKVIGISKKLFNAILDDKIGHYIQFNEQIVFHLSNYLITHQNWSLK